MAQCEMGCIGPVDCESSPAGGAQTLPLRENTSTWTLVPCMLCLKTKWQFLLEKGMGALCCKAIVSK